MRVGIVTFQRENNYGAILQSFALQKVIGSLGIECETIDYQRNVVLDVIQWQKNKMKSFLVGKPDKQLYTNMEFLRMVILEKFFNYLSGEKFDEIRKKMNYSEKVNKRTIHRLEDKYDLIIAGSDQVWNPGRVNLDTTYLLDWVKDVDKKASYAASFGIDEIPAKYVEKYRQCLHNYKYYSCREAQGITILEQLVHKDGSVVLDPTMLMNGNEWTKYVKRYHKKEPYILVYQLGLSNTLLQCAKKLAVKKGLKIIALPYPRQGKNVQWMSGIGPQEWMGLIQGAEFVITNSFHGVVFSILFERKVYIEVEGQRVRAAMSSRIKNLVSMLEIEDRVMEENGMINDDMDYDKIRKQIEKYRESSIHYLKYMLKETRK